jgi:nucleoid DNA-binding protein
MNSYTNTGRARLVRELMAKGLSMRKAEKAVNAVFERMTWALRRGEIVEIPGGWIQLKWYGGKPRREWHGFRNVNTGKLGHTIVTYRGRRRVVKFKPDLKLDLTRPPAPPPPHSDEQIDCRKLAGELLGGTANDQVMARLERAAQHPIPKPGALLRRLRAIRERGWRHRTAEELAANIASLYWV